MTSLEGCWCNFITAEPRLTGPLSILPNEPTAYAVHLCVQPQMFYDRVRGKYLDVPTHWKSNAA